MDDVTNLVKELNDFEIHHEVHTYGGVRHSFTIKNSRDKPANRTGAELHRSGEITLLDPFIDGGFTVIGPIDHLGNSQEF